MMSCPLISKDALCQCPYDSEAQGASHGEWSMLHCQSWPWSESRDQVTVLIQFQKFTKSLHDSDPLSLKVRVQALVNGQFGLVYSVAAMCQ